VAQGLLASDPAADFPAVDGHFGRPGKAELDAVAADGQDSDFDIAADHDDFATFPTENQHGIILLPLIRCVCLSTHLYATADWRVRVHPRFGRPLGLPPKEALPRCRKPFG
jgi:hypothetical protein